MPEKIPVAILAATGLVGQRFVQLLDNHPWFKVVALTGSPRAVGQRYGDACHWVLAEEMPGWAAALIVQATEPDDLSVPLVFSALPSSVARAVEPGFARAGTMVCSNASAYRREPDVPLLMPEVNPDHLSLLAVQRERRGWSGGIVTNSNCTSAGMTVALKALRDAFGVRRVFAVSLQALSGAGYPGVASLDILNNVIPYIEGEEEKVEWESRKMLGALREGAVELAGFAVSAHTNRVAVSDGHLVTLSVELESGDWNDSHKNDPAGLELAAEVLRKYTAPPPSRHLPSAPRPVILVRDEPDRPQPRLDRMAGGGMTTVVGRLRPDPLFHLKMVVLSHNTIRGAAGGSIYNAELLLDQGWLR